jgi:hypothetical protein
MLRRTSLALALLAYAPSAHADLIGIDFTGGGSTGPIALVPAEVAGAVTQANWNNADLEAGGLFPLTDGTGANSGVLIRWESPNTWSSGSGASPTSGNDLLMGVGWLWSRDETTAPVQSTVVSSRDHSHPTNLGTFLGPKTISLVEPDGILSRTRGASVDIPPSLSRWL